MLDKDNHLNYTITDLFKIIMSIYADVILEYAYLDYWFTKRYCFSPPDTAKAHGGEGGGVGDGASIDLNLVNKNLYQLNM